MFSLNTTDDKFTQPSKVLIPVVVTLGGNLMLLRLMQFTKDPVWKLTDEDRLTDVNFSNSSKLVITEFLLDLSLCPIVRAAFVLVLCSLLIFDIYEYTKRNSQQQSFKYTT